MYVFRIVFERHVSKNSKICSLGGYITLFYEAPFDLGLRPWTNTGNQFLHISLVISFGRLHSVADVGCERGVALDATADGRTPGGTFLGREEAGPLLQCAGWRFLLCRWCPEGSSVRHEGVGPSMQLTAQSPVGMSLDVNGRAPRCSGGCCCAIDAAKGRH